MSRRQSSSGSVSQQISSLSFSQQELFDLAVAWVALAVAFGIFFDPENRLLFTDLTAFLQLVVVCFLTVGVAFMLHELAHKVAAIRFGQVAAFRASYEMLGLAILSAMVGFIFAAPGAVEHRGRITTRQHGLIAVAGPWVNLALVAVFAPLLLFDGFLGSIGEFGVIINAFLAAFNMIPFGPLDGNTVKDWSLPVFGVTLVVAAVITVVAISTIGFPTV